MSARSVDRVLVDGGVVIAAVVAASVGCNTLSGAEELVVASCEGAGCMQDGDRGTSQAPTKPREHGDAGGSNGQQNGMGGGGSGAGSGNGGSGGGTDTVVECGTTTCSGSNEACCVGAGKTCIEKGDACIGVVVECGGRANCSQGEVCCFDANAMKAECRAEDSCFGESRVALCRSDDDCPEGATCQPTQGALSEHGACK